MKRFVSAILGFSFAACAMAAPTSQPALTPHVVRLADIRYGSAPGKFNLLDLYLPDHPDHARPLIVWVHGGGWSMGDKMPAPALPLIPRGYILASINYRLAPRETYPAQIEDCKGAIRFLRAHAGQYNIDPDRIGAWGASAGGHLVSLLGTSAGSADVEGNVGGNLDKSSRVQAVCDWFGPTDLTQFATQAQAAGIISRTPGPTLIMGLFGGSLLEKRRLVQEANPIAFLTKKSAGEIPPFLIMHGDKDPIVPIAQSKLLVDALKAAGVSVDFRIVQGAGHGNGFATPAVAKIVMDFFDKQLKPR
jgi:acetyl esterase/lipase